MIPESSHPKINTVCDWHPRTKDCSYPGEKKDVYKTWGGKNCQFNENGQCKQAIWHLEEVTDLNEQMDKFHENWRKLHDGQSFPNR